MFNVNHYFLTTYEFNFIIEAITVSITIAIISTIIIVIEVIILNE